MFSKKPDHNSPLQPMERPVASNNATFSVIGNDIAIKGDIEAKADLHVDGRVNGDLTCASLVQGESSLIEGSITAESARLSGHVKGTIAAKNLVVLKTAKIEGDVNYETLTIEQGAVVDGRFALANRRGQAEATPQQGAPAKGDDAERKLSLAG